MPSDWASGLSSREAEPLVRIEHVTKEYLRGNEKVIALHDVSFSISYGSVAVVLGPSGGGKSTLLHILGGMDRSTTGNIHVLGQDISGWTSDQLAQYRRETVGFIFQSFHLISNMTALENVELPLMLAGVPKETRRLRAMELLDRVGLADRHHHQPGELSGGQAQRVAIARALAADPPLILADEPTGNLDSQSGQEILSLLTSLAHEDGHCVVIVTNNEDFVAYADQILRIRDGDVQEQVQNHPSSATQVERGNMGRAGWLTLYALTWHSLVHRLARGLLTGLGIAIGVAAMVLLIGLGSGLKTNVVQGVLSLGPLNAINVSPQVNKSHSGSFLGSSVVSGPSHPITPKTLVRLSHLSGARGAYLNATFVAGATYHGRSTTAALNPLPPIKFWSVPGVLPTTTKGHVSGKPLHILLPLSVAQALMGGTHPQVDRILGKTIVLHVETVSGGLFSGQGLTGPSHSIGNQSVVVAGFVHSGLGFVPYSTALIWFKHFSANSHDLHYPGATVLARSLSQVTPLSHHIESMGYSTTTLQQALQSINKSFGLIETGLGAVGAIALVVAGLMIGVVMSMAVLERRKEIGILRAIGARRRDISRLFLLEALSIGLIGGIVGIAIGSGVGYGINALVHHSSQFSHGIFTLPLWLVGIGLLFGGGVSIIAGAVPASHASSLNPVDALRQE
jgi:macrolide transport system ATP-binding/permease protein